MGLYYTDDKWDTDQQLSKAGLRIETIKSGLHVHSTSFTNQIAKKIIENNSSDTSEEAASHLRNEFKKMLQKV